VDKKAEIRFRQVNHLCDRVIKHLEPSHGLVLLIGWRHADTKNTFSLSESRIAESTGLTVRHIRTVIHKLIDIGALILVEPGLGTKAATYRITGEPTHDA
jgi:hypothetical protein